METTTTTTEPVEELTIVLAAEAGKPTPIFIGDGTDYFEIVESNIVDDSMIVEVIDGAVYATRLTPDAEGSILVRNTNTGELTRIYFTSESGKTVVSYKYQATNETLFRFSHDETEFQPDMLIEELQRCAVYDDDSEGEWETVDDLSIVSFNGQTPKSVFDSQNEPMCRTGVTAVVTDILPNGETAVQEITVGDVLIAIKGDTNIDGEVNAVDASEILIYAAEQGAGNTSPQLYNGDDAVTEQFVQFLADVNDNSNIDSEDAAYILTYAAQQGTGQEPDWNEITHTVDVKLDEKE